MAGSQSLKVAEPAPRRRGRPPRDAADRLGDELLDRALEHFLDKGFEGTTISAITASLGMSKQTVYARYGDKLALFEAALQRAVDAWVEPLERLPDMESEDLETTLIDVARLIVTTLMQPAGVQLIRITNAEAYRLPAIGVYTYRRGHQKIARYLSDLFRRRIFAGATEPPDLDDIATTFLNLMSGPARRSAWGMHDDIDLESFVRQRVGLFLHGVMPRR